MRCIAEAAGHLFVGRHAPAQILELDLFEAHFARAADIKRHGAVLRDILVGLAVGAAGLRSIVDPRAEVVGVEDDLERVPLVRPVGVDRTGVGRVRRQCRRPEASSCPASSLACSSAGTAPEARLVRRRAAAR